MQLVTSNVSDSETGREAIRAFNRGRPSDYRLQLIDLVESHRLPDVRASWERLFEACDHPNAFHTSPAWADYVAARGAPVRVVVVRKEGTVVGVAPVLCHRYGLDYEIGSRGVFRNEFRVADVFGSLPLVPDDESVARGLVAHLLGALPECDAVLFESLPVESTVWNLGTLSTDSFFGYHPTGIDDAHVVEIGPSFDDYVRARRSKVRYNAQRAVRTLREAGGGTLELRCHRSLSDVDRLFDDASRVRRLSWQLPALGELRDDDHQSSREGLHELARRGLLRSYVLRAGETPCAFVIGYQYRGVYFYAVVGYDPAYSRHSPGIALLYLMLEDLFANDRPRLVSFGRGDDDYKRRFGTRTRRVGRCLVFRPTLRNRIRVQQHRLFAGVKGLLSRSL